MPAFEPGHGFAYAGAAEAEPVSRISIGVASSPADWDDARELMLEYLDWIEGETGRSIFDLQDHASDEVYNLPAFYAGADGALVLARLGALAVGTAGVRLIAPGTAELKRVYVRPVARGRGLARRLLEAAIDRAAALGASRLRLETEPVLMATAHRLYRDNGFREIPPYTALAERYAGVVAMELLLR